MSRDFKIIAIDFDGTIAHYDGWKGLDVFGEPIEGAVEAIQKLKAEGHKIIIHTCRRPTDKLKDYLKEHNIPYDEINGQYPDSKAEKYRQGDPSLPIKIHADIYIDDRGMQFQGSWEDMLYEIEDFVPWHKR